MFKNNLKQKKNWDIQLKDYGDAIALGIFLGEMGLKKRMLTNRQQGRNLRKAQMWEGTGLRVRGN